MFNNFGKVFEKNLLILEVDNFVKWRGEEVKKFYLGTTKEYPKISSLISSRFFLWNGNLPEKFLHSALACS